eukprot:gene4921-5568_t
MAESFECEDFDNFLSNAISNVDTLRHMEYQKKSGTKKKSKSRRGPKATVVKLKLYHLPEASEIPNFAVTTHGLVKQHMNQGYGFPKECFNDSLNKAKAMSVSIHLSESQIDMLIQEIFPTLRQREFQMFKMNKRKKREVISKRDAMSLWELKYQGVLLVQQGPRETSSASSSTFNANESTGTPASFSVASSEPTTTVISQANQDATAAHRAHAPRDNFSGFLADTQETENSNTPILQWQFSSTVPINSSNFAEGVSGVNSLIEITIITQRSTERYRFNKQCNPRDIYSSVAAKEGIEDFVLIDANKRDYVLPKYSNLSLEQWSIGTGRSFIVEENTWNDVLSVQGDEEDEEVSLRPAFGEDVMALNRIQARSSMSCTQQLIVRRGKLLEDTIEQYKDPQILQSKIYVHFQDEQGDDLDGLTRELFSQFWLKLKPSFAGTDKVYPVFNPVSMMNVDELNAIGRVLLHGYILCGYLPYYINYGVLYWILTGQEMSGELMLEQFIQSLDEGDKSLINTALTEAILTENTRIHLAAILGKYDLGVLPRKEKLKSILVSLARYVILVKPFFYLQNMRDPIAAAALKLIGKPKESDFCHLLQSLMPNGLQVVAKLSLNLSDDAELQALESRVADYLQTFLVSLNQTDAATFLRFVSGSEILQATIRVEFNGEINEERMVPKANTCSCSLHISRYFLTFQSLSEIMKRLLANPELWSRFDMI